MSLATKTLNKQKRIYFSYFWRGLALMAIGVYAGIKILKDGMGSSVETGRGVNVLLRKLMVWLTERGVNAEQLLPIFMIGLFFTIATIGFYYVVRGAWLMVPSHTLLGKSILTQKKSSESFWDVVDSINADMEQEPQVFGSVNIGHRWILDAQAMRIANIRGVFWFDEGKEDYVLFCVDESANIWAASLRYCDERYKAAAYLKKMLPDIATGDKNDYLLFLGEE